MSRATLMLKALKAAHTTHGRAKNMADIYSYYRMVSGFNDDDPSSYRLLGDPLVGRMRGIVDRHLNRVRRTAQVCRSAIGNVERMWPEDVRISANSINDSFVVMAQRFRRTGSVDRRDADLFADAIRNWEDQIKSAQGELKADRMQFRRIREAWVRFRLFAGTCRDFSAGLTRLPIAQAGAAVQDTADWADMADGARSIIRHYRDIERFHTSLAADLAERMQWCRRTRPRMRDDAAVARLIASGIVW